MTRIGIVDLDTSHPENWIPLEREMGCEIVGVWDGGSVHPAQYVQDFARKMEIPRVYQSLKDLAQDVDCAIIHGCDWDTHVAKARPFITRGKSVLLDKPLAGNVRDLHQIKSWAEGGARITGGSSLRFCFETQEFLALPLAERGTPDTVLCGCGVDDFNYGIHAYSLLCGILGPGIRSVRHLGKRGQRRIQVTWQDGRVGLLIIGEAAVWLPFYGSIMTERKTTQFQPDAGRIYRALLENCLPYLAGKTDRPPVPMEHLIEAELAALAARKSWINGNVEVPLESLTEADGGYDGPAFAVSYRKMKYPDQKSK